MKKYLFGLGAMLVGAGLMFVFTHTEVSAKSKTISLPDGFVCNIFGKIPKRKLGEDRWEYQNSYSLFHCETKTLDCAVLKNKKQGWKELACFKK